jgi:hypothetical protein
MRNPVDVAVLLSCVLLGVVAELDLASAAP